MKKLIIFTTILILALGFLSTAQADPSILEYNGVNQKRPYGFEVKKTARIEDGKYKVSLEALSLKQESIDYIFLLGSQDRLYASLFDAVIANLVPQIIEHGVKHDLDHRLAATGSEGGLFSSYQMLEYNRVNSTSLEAEIIAEMQKAAVKTDENKFIFKLSQILAELDERDNPLVIDAIFTKPLSEQEDTVKAIALALKEKGAFLHLLLMNDGADFKEYIPGINSSENLFVSFETMAETIYQSRDFSRASLIDDLPSFVNPQSLKLSAKRGQISSLQTGDLTTPSQIIFEPASPVDLDYKLEGSQLQLANFALGQQVDSNKLEGSKLFIEYEVDLNEQILPASLTVPGALVKLGGKELLASKPISLSPSGQKQDSSENYFSYEGKRIDPQRAYAFLDGEKSFRPNGLNNTEVDILYLLKDEDANFSTYTLEAGQSYQKFVYSHTLAFLSDKLISEHALEEAKQKPLMAEAGKPYELYVFAKPKGQASYDLADARGKVVLNSHLLHLNREISLKQEKRIRSENFPLEDLLERDASLDYQVDPKILQPNLPEIKEEPYIVYEFISMGRDVENSQDLYDGELRFVIYVNNQQEDLSKWKLNSPLVLEGDEVKFDLQFAKVKQDFHFEYEGDPDFNVRPEDFYILLYSDSKLSSFQLDSFDFALDQLYEDDTHFFLLTPKVESRYVMSPRDEDTPAIFLFREFKAGTEALKSKLKFKGEDVINSTTIISLGDDQ